MDAYDPVVEQEAKDTKQSAASDPKIEKAVSDIGDRVQKVYSEVESGTKQGWSSLGGLFGNLQKSIPQYAKDFDIQKQLQHTKDTLNTNFQNLKLAENDPKVKELKQKSAKVISGVSTNTNKMLDDLDSHLEKVENATFGYASQLTSFFQAKTGIKLGLVSNADAASTEQESEVLFNIPKGVAGTRVEAQLHELETSAELYVKKFKESKETVDAYEVSADEENEKAKLESSPLGTLRAEVVPKSFDDEFFWKCYFSTRASIIGEENKRKELLKKSTEEEDEDFDWDDDDDEDDNNNASAATKAKA